MLVCFRSESAATSNENARFLLLSRPPSQLYPIQLPALVIDSALLPALGHRHLSGLLDTVSDISSSCGVLAERNLVADDSVM